MTDLDIEDIKKDLAEIKQGLAQIEKPYKVLAAELNEIRGHLHCLGEIVRNEMLVNLIRVKPAFELFEKHNNAFLKALRFMEFSGSDADSDTALEIQGYSVEKAEFILNDVADRYRDYCERKGLL